MNERRFKELLNLHLDHRLTEGEAAELEQALRADPARRRMLASYATMQRGCTVLCHRSAAGAPASQAVLRAIRDADRKVAGGYSERPPVRAWTWGAWSTAAGMAAVAAVMIIRVESPGGFAANETETIAETTMVAAIQAAPPEVSPGELGTLISDQPAAAPAPGYFLPPHLTLAALGISNETREIGVVSSWSHPLNDITQAEVERAAAWARAASSPEWAVDATAATRFGADWSAAATPQASAASFTFER